MSKIQKIYEVNLSFFKKIIASFSLTEKGIIIIFIIFLFFSGLSILEKVNSLITTKVPTAGGTLTEGLIGSARFINPLLELSDSDRDLTYLIYSGLLRVNSEGELIPDLAESYSISDDGLVYSFKIRDDAYFHDGTEVTSDDVKYTIQMIQDINLRSPKRNNWLGVQVEKINNKELSFTLKQPYSPFIENTTIGILPKHIWHNATIDEFSLSIYNTEPIGSGPYMIDKIKRNSLGIPNVYELKSFKKYTLGAPFVKNLKIIFFSNEKSLYDAYVGGLIDSTSNLSLQSINNIEEINEKSEKIALPRIFGLFFNQNQAKIFLNKEIRQVLNMTVDRDRIVAQALGNYGDKITGPLPAGIINETDSDLKYDKEIAIAEAKEILLKNNWKFNEDEKVWEKVISKNETQKLAFSISTSNTPDLKIVADILKEDWSLLGIQIEIQAIDPLDLNQNVITQRNYDALLFGQVINRSLDLFAFWHSSQRNTGYNLANYTNSKVDKLLEEARQISDREKRLEKYKQVEAEIKNDTPAIFLYSPEFIYIIPDKIKGFKSGLVNNRSERFGEIYNWYIETNDIWNILISN